MRKAVQECAIKHVIDEAFPDRDQFTEFHDVQLRREVAKLPWRRQRLKGGAEHADRSALGGAARYAGRGQFGEPGLRQDGLDRVSHHHPGRGGEGSGPVRARRGVRPVRRSRWRGRLGEVRLATLRPPLCRWSQLQDEREIVRPGSRSRAASGRLMLCQPRYPRRLALEALPRLAFHVTV